MSFQQLTGTCHHSFSAARAERPLEELGKERSWEAHPLGETQGTWQLCGAVKGMQGACRALSGDVVCSVVDWFPMGKH